MSDTHLHLNGEPGPARPRESLTAFGHAIDRLFAVALRDTGQSRRVADFLLAWHNAGENGGWDPTDLWNVDAPIARDMLAVLTLISVSHRYPGDMGWAAEIDRVWQLWRAPRRGARGR